MSQIEDPAVTVARLLKTNMHVVKDSGVLASVEVSGEWQNNDALKVGDGQVTVGLAETADQKLELSGKIRRKTAALRVNVWATDKPNADESGKVIRQKIVDQVNRIVRQNRTAPNVTVYNYVGLSAGGQGSRAFSGGTEAAPSAGWAELSALDYPKLWYSDDSRCQISASEMGAYGVLLFGFQIESREDAVKQAVLSFEGYGSAPGGDGVTVKAYNHTAGEWQNAQTNIAGTADETLTLTLNANFPDFIDSEGYLWFFARTSNPSDGVSPAVLACDHAYCTVTVSGVTYLDVAGYRNLDRTDIKPPIYRTEFTVKSWLIENIGV